MSTNSTTSSFDATKLAEIVLYIAERNLHNETFGKAKLHKQLWMSDFRHYSLTGRPITGATYLHREHGPFCQELEEALNVLEDRQHLLIQLRDRFPYTQQKPVPLARCDYSVFSAEEIAAVEDILWDTRQLTAIDLIQRSHLHPGWYLTEEGDEISYEFARIPVDMPFEEPWTARAQALAAGG